MEQVEGNVASANVSGINTLTSVELALVEQVRARYQELSPIPCTQCGYCMPCPNGVNIPRNLEIYNGGKIYDKPGAARESYNVWLPENERASACLDCDECEDKCPQSIPISEWMPRIHQVLGEGRPYPAPN
jgi:predicted aldo/keto reductase-like oxidoreductase